MAILKGVNILEFSRRSSISVSSGCDKQIGSEHKKHKNVISVKTVFPTIGAFIQDIMQTHVLITLQAKLYCFMRLILHHQVDIIIQYVNSI